MRDYQAMRDDGTVVRVADMETAEIVDLIANGFMPRPGSAVTREAFIERLRIELVIRSLGL